jgi:hypothetical protein
MTEVEDRIRRKWHALEERYVALKIAAWLLFVFFLFCVLAHAHDQFGNPNWIATGNYVSPIDGSHCCGLADCAVVEKEDVREVRGGLSVRGRVTYRGASWQGDIVQDIDEVVPHNEVQPSKDGRFWRCRKFDGSRRCFFAPPPGS